jgi:enoyl-CoA hydratase/carnithine racemase
MTAHLTTSRSNGVLSIRLTRPAKLNALTGDTVRGLVDAFRSARDAGTFAVVIEAEGAHFSAGADIHEMDQLDEAGFRRNTAAYQDACRAARDCGVPIIAALKGYVVGGGLEIALLADIRVADSTLVIQLPDVEVGFTPSGGLTWLLPRIVGAARAAELLLLCRRIDAIEAHSWGLLNEVVDDGQVDSRAHEIADRLASSRASGPARTLLVAHLDADLETALAAEFEADAQSFLAPDTAQNLRSFVER